MKTKHIHKIVLLLAGAVVFAPIRLSAIEPSQEAALSRYYTLMFGGLREDDPVLKTSRRVEAIMFGLLIYYYHFEDDPDFTSIYRGALVQALIQHKLDPEVIAQPLLDDLTRKMTIEQSQGFMELSGFDKKTSRRIVSDARADNLAVFFKWLREDPKYKKMENKSEQATPRKPSD